MTNTKIKGTGDAVRLANAIVGQWRQAIKEGIALEEYRALLAQDLDSLSEALEVLTEWVPL